MLQVGDQLEREGERTQKLSQVFTEYFKKGTSQTLPNVKTLDLLELIHICACTWVRVHIHRHQTGDEENRSRF